MLKTRMHAFLLCEIAVLSIDRVAKIMLHHYSSVTLPLTLVNNINSGYFYLGIMQESFWKIAVLAIKF